MMRKLLSEIAKALVMLKGEAVPHTIPGYSVAELTRLVGFAHTHFTSPTLLITAHHASTSSATMQRTISLYNH